jgi:predicted amidohydrolase YtcJ
MVLANAKVYTCADDVTSADAVVVEDGAITFVGDMHAFVG